MTRSTATDVLFLVRLLEDADAALATAGSVVRRLSERGALPWDVTGPLAHARMALALALGATDGPAREAAMVTGGATVPPF